MYCQGEPAYHLNERSCCSKVIVHAHTYTHTRTHTHTTDQLLSTGSKMIRKNFYYMTAQDQQQLEMWANAQHDDHPAEYKWRPLFNAAKFG